MGDRSQQQQRTSHGQLGLRFVQQQQRQQLERLAMLFSLAVTRSTGHLFVFFGIDTTFLSKKCTIRLQSSGLGRQTLIVY